MNEQKQPIIFLGDVVSICTTYPHPKITGAVFYRKNGLMRLLCERSHRFNPDNNFYTVDVERGGLTYNKIKSIQLIQSAQDAIPQMTDGRFQKDDLVYVEDITIRCLVGNVVAAFQKFIVIETDDGKLLRGGSKSCTPLIRRNDEEHPEIRYGKKAYRIVKGEHIWGDVVGYGVRGRNVVVKNPKNNIHFIGPIERWTFFND